MIKKSTEKLLKISAYISLFLGVLSVLFILTFLVSLFISQRDLNLSKLFAVNIILIVIAIAIFFFFFGVYEFLKHIVLVEKEIDQIEDEIKIIAPTLQHKDEDKDSADEPICSVKPESSDRNESIKENKK